MPDVRLLLVAPPGAGKGTQAQRLADHYGIAHLASGDLLRTEVEAGSETGTRAAQYMSRGDLVPDDVVLQVVLGRVLEAARQGGYVLDGFPRTLNQAEEVHRAAEHRQEIELQGVVHLHVRRHELRRRMLARAELEGRTDDTPATIDHRLDVYAHETEPLVDYYARRGLVVEVDGDRPADDVFSDIVAGVDRQLAERSAGKERTSRRA
jgi:adenylate kinase